MLNIIHIPVESPSLFDSLVSRGVHRLYRGGQGFKSPFNGLRFFFFKVLENGSLGLVGYWSEYMKYSRPWVEDFNTQKDHQSLSYGDFSKRKLEKISRLAKRIRTRDLCDTGAVLSSTK